jgi:hypothetical protein
MYSITQSIPDEVLMVTAPGLVSTAKYAGWFREAWAVAEAC